MWTADQPPPSSPTQLLPSSSLAPPNFGWDMGVCGGVSSCDSSPLPPPPMLGPRKGSLEIRLWFSRFHSNGEVVFENPLSSSTLSTPDL